MYVELFFTEKRFFTSLSTIENLSLYQKVFLCRRRTPTERIKFKIVLNKIEVVFFVKLFG